MKKYVLLITFLVVLATSSAYANDLHVAIGDGAYYGTLTHSIVRIEVAMVTGTLNTMSDTIAITYDLGGISPWVGYTRRNEQYYTEIEVTKTRLEIIDGEIVQVPYMSTEIVKRWRDSGSIAFGVRGEFWHDRLGLVVDAGKYVKGVTAIGQIKYRFHDSYTANIGYLTSADIDFSGIVGGISITW